MATFFAEQSKLLTDWAEREASLSLPEGNTTRRKNLEFFRRKKREAGLDEEQLDKLFPELVEIEVSPPLSELKSVFAALNSTRAQGFNGPLPITFMEIQAFCSLLDVALSPNEVTTLKNMDTVYLNIVTEHLNTKKE